MKENNIQKISIDFHNTIKILPGDFERIFHNKLPSWFCGLLTWVIGRPNQKIIKILRELVNEKKKDCEITILTSTPKFWERRLKKWLSRHDVPFTEIICTGPIKRKLKKLKAIKEKRIQLSIDDDLDSAFSPENSIDILKAILLGNYPSEAV
ncbi:MAG: hypothetical protein IB617_03035 [Candidatus Nealsonbacteria bacterium]|nr:MAG: hypothetical protein IB617_03035 [Candidatus Nealsonbacteria bacterium]